MHDNPPSRVVNFSLHSADFLVYVSLYERANVRMYNEAGKYAPQLHIKKVTRKLRKWYTGLLDG